MRFSTIINKRVLSLCIAVLLAVGMTLWIAAPVRAEGNGQEGQPDNNTTQEQQLHDEETRPEVTAFEEAKAELLALCGQDEKEVIEGLPAEDPYLREDLVEALSKCTLAISRRQNLEAQLELMVEQILKSDLPGEIQNQYESVLTKQMGYLTFDSMTELMEAIHTVESGSQVPISLEKTDGFQMKVDALTRQIRGLSQALDSYGYLMHEFDQETGDLVGRNGKTSQDGALSLKLEELSSRKDQLIAMVEDFFALPEEDQVALPDWIRQLKEDTSAFVLSAGVAENELAVNKKITDMEGQVRRAMLLAVLGAGAALVAIAGAIVATVSAIRAASKEPEIDLSETASKESLSSLNRAFQAALDNVERKTDEQFRSMKEAQQNVKLQLDQVKSTSEQKKETPIPSRPVPQKKPKDFLRLKYETIAPRNSSLISDSQGNLILYQDMTLERKQDPDTKVNEMKGWQSQGLFFLFNPQIDGYEMNLDRDVLPDGFYQAGRVVRLAQVSPIGNSYKLESKGCIEMTKC